LKSASTIACNQLPERPLNDVTAGLDWARDDHAVSIVDSRGREVARFSVEHTSAGLGDLVAVLNRHSCNEVGIERSDGPVVEALLEAGITVVVISPNQVKNLRGRYGSAGNKDDRFDAFVLADTLRTDRTRLRPLTPDSDATLALRRACRARKDLVSHRVGVANQLREHLKRVFPGAVGLFAEIDSPISLTFLTRFDCQDRADWLSPKRLTAWLASVGYCGRVDPGVLHARLSAAPYGATGDHGATEVHVTRALLAVLITLTEQIKTLSTQISEQLAVHADAHVFTSLPRSGRVRAARLLAEIGDCRTRFPTPEALTCLGRRRPLDPPIRQDPCGRLPLGLRQTTARCRHRLRRRLAPSQPVGRRPLQPCPRPRPRPPACRPHPGPSMAAHHLALLAAQHRLRPHPTRRPPTPPPRSTTHGLTQGYS
jgi:transposase